MYTNADITIYLYDGGKYTRTPVEKVFWSDTKQSNIKETGLTNADSVKIMIPISSANNLEFTTSKDLVVKGIIDYEVDSTSQQTISNSLATLNKTYDVHTITSADDKRYGSSNMWHYDLSCK
jgi:hypothetical protein